MWRGGVGKRHVERGSRKTSCFLPSPDAGEGSGVRFLLLPGAAHTALRALGEMLRIYAFHPQITKRRDVWAAPRIFH